jgi:S-ribosylhomocysteine lyase LuxS involved in autoinducer biosynthesis
MQAVYMFPLPKVFRVVKQQFFISPVGCKTGLFVIIANHRNQETSSHKNAGRIAN